MELSTFSYKPQQGWSVKKIPDLDSPNTLIIAFGAPEYIDNPASILELRQYYPKAKIIGCSSAGEIFGSTVVDKSLTVAVIRFKHTSIIDTVTSINNAENSFAAGIQIAEKLNRPDLTAVFVLSDGLNVNGTELVKGINSVLSPNVVVTGGLAGDGDRFKRTWIIHNAKPQTNAIVAIGLYGDKVKIGHGSKGGWDSFGPERHVTKSKGNILYELDGKPALALYKEYLGERAEGLPATGLLFPLAIRKDAEDQRQLVRTILAVDEKAQSMIFAGDIPKGYLAQLMRANFDRLVTGANDAAKLAGKNQTVKSPVLSLAISCVGRRLVLGERIEEEIESTLESLPSGTEQIGFYSYGELSPYATGTCDLHNQTMTLTTISEE